MMGFVQFFDVSRWLVTYYKLLFSRHILVGKFYYDQIQSIIRVK